MIRSLSSSSRPIKLVDKDTGDGAPIRLQAIEAPGRFRDFLIATSFLFAAAPAYAGPASMTQGGRAAAVSQTASVTYLIPRGLEIDL